MEVVDAISNVKTTTLNRYRNVPVTPVEIVKVLSGVNTDKKTAK
jgi:hypothetical protein